MQTLRVNIMYSGLTDRPGWAKQIRHSLELNLLLPFFDSRHCTCHHLTQSAGLASLHQSKGSISFFVNAAGTAMKGWFNSQKKDGERSKGHRIFFWGKIIQFLAAGAVLPRSVWKKRMNSTVSFTSTQTKQLERQENSALSFLSCHAPELDFSVGEKRLPPLPHYIQAFVQSIGWPISRSHD